MQYGNTSAYNRHTSPDTQLPVHKISTSDRTHTRNRHSKDEETKSDTRKDGTQAFTETHVCNTPLVHPHTLTTGRPRPPTPPPGPPPR